MPPMCHPRHLTAAVTHRDSPMRNHNLARGSVSPRPGRRPLLAAPRLISTTLCVPKHSTTSRGLPKSIGADPLALQIRAEHQLRLLQPTPRTAQIPIAQCPSSALSFPEDCPTPASPQRTPIASCLVTTGVRQSLTGTDISVAPPGMRSAPVSGHRTAKDSFLLIGSTISSTGKGKK